MFSTKNIMPLQLKVFVAYIFHSKVFSPFPNYQIEEQLLTDVKGIAKMALYKFDNNDYAHNS